METNHTGCWIYRLVETDMLRAWDKLMRTPPPLPWSIRMKASQPSNPPPPPPLCHEMRLKWAHQSGVDSGRICAVGEVIGVILAGGGRSGVGRAVHPKSCVQLRPAARQEPVLVRGTAEGGGGGGCGGLGGACPVRNRPGNRIAASRTGVCRHEKLHEEKRGQTWSLAALIWMWWLLKFFPSPSPFLKSRSSKNFKCVCGIFFFFFICPVKQVSFFLPFFLHFKLLPKKKKPKQNKKKEKVSDFKDHLLNEVKGDKR